MTDCPGGAVRIGTAPVNWNNDDLPDWAPAVPFPALIAEMAATGYQATEYGSGFPRNPSSLRAALAGQRLALAGAYQWLHLTDPATLATERPRLADLVDLLAAAGGHDLVIANSMTPERIAIAGRVPADGSAGLTDEGWRRLAASLGEVASFAAKRGIRTHYHNHVGSFVETPAEVERLLAEADPALLDLCFDTGHYAYGGGDAVDFVERHADRIGYVHLKDVDREVLRSAPAAGLSFLDALKVGVFCELGKGAAQIDRLVSLLLDRQFAGWIIVEQDTSTRPASLSARANREYLREHFGI